MNCKTAIDFQLEFHYFFFGKKLPTYYTYIKEHLKKKHVCKIQRNICTTSILKKFTDISTHNGMDGF